MRIKMKRSVSGLYGDGKRLPRSGECGDVETTMAKDLCDKDYAEKCGNCDCGEAPKKRGRKPKVERATASPGEER